MLEFYIESGRRLRQLRQSSPNQKTDSVLSIPSFIGTLPATVKHFLRKFPAHTLEPGDVMITNDPWTGTGHIHDVNVAMPIFDKGVTVRHKAAPPRPDAPQPR